MFVIMKNGKFVKNFSDGTKFTSNLYTNQVETYLSKKSAKETAREYGRKNGKGYRVVEL